MGVKKLALSLIAAAVLASPAAACLEFSTVTQGSQLPPVEPPRSVYLARNAAAASSLAPFVDADSRPFLARIDYRRYVVVAAFEAAPDSCATVSITKLVRKKETLTVTAEMRRARPGALCALAVHSTYHVVKVRRAALGTPLPRRVRLVVRRA